ncbi:hypothetical protein HAX54_020625 [Datura stramonium]|uniref:Uncharacterized protein n=1 Tax=Datura stramonium TaxID=4076 RepID=A0ABS8UTJ0_DATST|nr:hypothetical protein [Datura stramonium]
MLQVEATKIDEATTSSWSMPGVYNVPQALSNIIGDFYSPHLISSGFFVLYHAACRVKATILEHFDSGNYVKLSAILEENLEKDPTCSHSMGRLISLHRSGTSLPEKSFYSLLPEEIRDTKSWYFHKVCSTPKCCLKDMQEIMLNNWLKQNYLFCKEMKLESNSTLKASSGLMR